MNFGIFPSRWSPFTAFRLILVDGMRISFIFLAVIVRLQCSLMIRLLILFAISHMIKICPGQLSHMIRLRKDTASMIARVIRFRLLLLMMHH